MNIPQSIEEKTVTSIGDMFNVPEKQPTLNSSTIIDVIRDNLNSSGKKAFDSGVAFYRTSHDEKTFIKNIIAVYSDFFSSALNKGNIDDNLKDLLIRFQKDTFKNIENQIDCMFTLLNKLSKEKVIDVNEISCNILGYAIETIRKNSQFKN